MKQSIAFVGIDKTLDEVVEAVTRALAESRFSGPLVVVMPDGSETTIEVGDPAAPNALLGRVRLTPIYGEPLPDPDDGCSIELPRAA